MPKRRHPRRQFYRVPHTSAPQIPDLQPYLRRPLLPFPATSATRKFRLTVFYDQTEDYEHFMREFPEYVTNYLDTATRALDSVNVELHSMSLAQLEQIVQEDSDDPELLIQCCLLEVCKVCPQDLVVAFGPTSQEIITEIKRRSANRPDDRHRILTLAEVTADQPMPPESKEAEVCYFQALVERLYAF